MGFTDLLDSLGYPDEIAALLSAKFGKKVPRAAASLTTLTHLGASDFCYAALNKVSRSFAVVIQQLPPELKDVICVFYLVLRGLDTVEDDMKFDIKVKIPLLEEFYTKLDQQGWKLEGVGSGKDAEEYKTLLAHFYKVNEVYATLKPSCQQVIKDICKTMGEGMAKYARKGHMETIAEYNEYCYYVAGLIGVGLSRLFAASGCEDSSFNSEAMEKLGISMGLFLQKTNIIRDYLEDLDEGRTWWPTEIWRHYAHSLEDFKKNPTSPNSLACLNHMITDALTLIPDCLTYLSKLRHPSIFAFCGIPQVMAIATLAKCYDNSDVFKKNVKIRKGLACKMMLETNNVASAFHYFYRFSHEIGIRVRIDDPSARKTTKAVMDATERTAPAAASREASPISISFLVVLAAIMIANGNVFGFLLVIGAIASLFGAFQHLAQGSHKFLPLESIPDHKDKKTFTPETERKELKRQSLDELREDLEKEFDGFVDEFLTYVRKDFGLKEKSVERLKYLLDYNVVGGKLNRGLLVLTTVQALCIESKRKDELDWGTLKKPAQLLAWCIEILQALFLVADDVMDRSSTRRGKPCWYKLEAIQLDAINDVLILESVIWFLLKKHFSQGPFASCYTKLVELYQEVSLQTQIGQMLDLSSQPQGRKGPEILATFNLDLYRQIVLYKTAFYSFYLPFASGLILCRHDSPDELKIALKISLEMGEKFQIEDDYLDCYGKPEMIGKDGTDIKDHKCTWLLVMALLRMTAEQRRFLEEHYGKEDEKSVEKVKTLYNELGIPDIYLKQEQESYDKIVKLIDEASQTIPTSVFIPILKKIHLRQK